MSLVQVAAAAALLLAWGARPVSPESIRGTYRVRASATLDRVPLARSLTLRGDVVLGAGGTAPAVTARLASRGQACRLDGRVAADGALAFARGQRCTFVFDEPELRGRVEAVLQGGRGAADEAGRLTLALEFALSGSVRLATGGLPGFPVEADVPVDGPASLTAEGTRDNSRGADR